MRSSSAAALRRISEIWSDLLAENSGKELAWAQVIFDVADLLAAHENVLHALTDVARTVADRIAFVREIFAEKVDAIVLDLLLALVREKWAAPADLHHAIELLGVDTVLIGAQRAEELSKTEEELYQSMRVLKNQRQLRLVLHDVQYAQSARADFAAKVFAHVNPYSKFLIARAVHRAPHHSIASSLSSYLARCADHAQHLVASVTSAIPLSQAQETRLAQILGAHYAQEVRLHTTIDPSVIGGVRIHVKDDVIDGTLQTRLAAVQASLKK